MDSILKSIKKLLGIAPEYKHFDNDIIMHINSVFMILTQIGIGPATGSFITNEMNTWKDVFGDITNIEAIKSFTYLRVRLLFDPPTSSALLESINRQAQELEWRLNVQAETTKQEV